MTWVPISLLAYALNALASLIDKVLLRRLIAHPAAYAFYVSALGLLIFVAAPFGFRLPSLPVLAASLSAGVLFVFALLAFFTALKRGEASRVVTLVGGLSPLAVVVVAWQFLGEILTLSQLVAFAIILLGGYLVAREGGRGRLTARVAWVGVLAALLFALSHVLMRYVYLNHPFLSGLLWRGAGSFVGAVVLLALPWNRRHILAALRHPEAKASALFLFGQVLAAAGFVLMNYAFSLGPVALVNALAGAQYVFLFLLVYLFGRRSPALVGEVLTKRVVREKVVSVILMAMGVFLLFV